MSIFCFLIPLFLFFWKINRSVFRNCLIFGWFTTNPYKSNSPERMGSMSVMFWRNLLREGKACFLSHRHTMQLKLLNLRRPFCFSSSYVASCAHGSARFISRRSFPPLLFRAPSSSYFPQKVPLIFTQLLYLSLLYLYLHYKAFLTL